MLINRKFEWEGLPSPLTKLLESQKPGVELLVSLSLFEGLSYFVNCDYKAEWAFPSQTLAQTLRHAHTESEQLPETVTWISL